MKKSVAYIVVSLEIVWSLTLLGDIEQGALIVTSNGWDVIEPQSTVNVSYVSIGEYEATSNFVLPEVMVVAPLYPYRVMSISYYTKSPLSYTFRKHAVVKQLAVNPVKNYVLAISVSVVNVCDDSALFVYILHALHSSASKFIIRNNNLVGFISIWINYINTNDFKYFYFW